MKEKLTINREIVKEICEIFNLKCKYLENYKFPAAIRDLENLLYPTIPLLTLKSWDAKLKFSPRIIWTSSKFFFILNSDKKFKIIEFV